MIDSKTVRTDDLAEALGVSTEAIRQWKSGYSRPDHDKIPVIARYFNVSADFLFGITEFKDNELREITVEEIGLTEIAVEKIKKMGMVRFQDGEIDLCNTEYLHLLNCIIESDGFFHFMQHLLYYYHYSNSKPQKGGDREYTGRDLVDSDGVLRGLGVVRIPYAEAASLYLNKALDELNSIAKKITSIPFPNKEVEEIHGDGQYSETD